MRNTVWNDFRMHVLHGGNTLNKLIAVNIAVFFGIELLGIIHWLVTQDLYTLADWFKDRAFSFPSRIGEFLLRPWTLVTYQFVHRSIWHLVFNMVMLMFAGRIFREFLGDRKLLSTYLLGGAAGALVFMVAYYLFPAFSGANGIMVGSSAAVLALLAGAATLVPNYTVFLILIGPVRLVYVALALFALDVLMLAGSNAGGHFAHLGGALWGFLYVRSLQNGRDIGGWLNTFFDKLARPFRRRRTMKVSYRNETVKQPASSGRGAHSATGRRKITQDEIDAILDKIHTSGYESLNQQEKDILFRASKEN